MGAQLGCSDLPANDPKVCDEQPAPAAQISPSMRKTRDLFVDVSDSSQPKSADKSEDQKSGEWNAYISENNAYISERSPQARQSPSKRRLLNRKVFHKPGLRPFEKGFDGRIESAFAPPEPTAELGAVPEAEVGTTSSVIAKSDESERIHNSGDSVRSDSSLDSCSSISSFRGKKRHGARRLLITHTMGSCPSSALKLIIENGDDIHKHFDIDKGMLGKGAFGIVQRAKLKSSGAVRAVKILSKERLKESKHMFKKEVEIMKELDHPNLLMLYEIFEDAEFMYLVLQMCSGGHLLGYIQKRGTLTEHQGAIVIQQIIRATTYMHMLSICHRDLKSENCLLETDGRDRKSVV